MALSISASDFYRVSDFEPQILLRHCFDLDALGIDDPFLPRRRPGNAVQTRSREFGESRRHAVLLLHEKLQLSSQKGIHFTDYCLLRLVVRPSEDLP